MRDACGFCGRVEEDWSGDYFPRFGECLICEECEAEMEEARYEWETP